MTTRITAKLWTDPDTFTSRSTTTEADVDDRTARLIGLGLLTDAFPDGMPGARVEIEVDRGRGPEVERARSLPSDCVHGLNYLPVRVSELLTGDEVYLDDDGEPASRPQEAKKRDRVTTLCAGADGTRLVGITPLRRWPVDKIVLVHSERSPSAVTRKSLSLDEIVSRAGDVGVLALAAAANVSDIRVRRAVREARDVRELDQREHRPPGRAEGLKAVGAVLEMLGWRGLAPVPIEESERVAADLLAKFWIRRDDARTAADFGRVGREAELAAALGTSLMGAIEAAQGCGKPVFDWMMDQVRLGVSERSHAQGIAGAVADVREFHLAAMEGNPHALLHERTAAPALVRAWSRYRLLKEEFEEYVQAGVDTDIAGVLDALIDVVYVAIGTGLLQFGGDRFERAWRAVHESNMAKRWPDGRFHINESGKIEKPQGWVGPDIAAIVNGGDCG